MVRALLYKTSTSSPDSSKSMELSEESESKKSLESLDIFAFQCTIYPLRSTAATNLRGKGTQCDVTNNLAGESVSGTNLKANCAYFESKKSAF